MKHDYSEMTTWQISSLYDEYFFPPFSIQWDDDIERHRQEIIDCIENDEPQREDAMRFRERSPMTQMV